MSTPPTNYDRQYNFEDFQTLNPTAPLPGQEIEAELNNIEISVNQTILRLNELQNSDGSLKIGSSLSAQTVALATTTATAVAETATEAYLTENYDPTIASQAAASASAANASMVAAQSSEYLASAHAGYAEQATLSAQNYSSQASTARAQARDYAIDANDSRNEALASEQSAAAHLADTNAVYISALQLKSNVDSQSNKFLNKREELHHAAANMLFNGGDISSDMISKVFSGTSFNSNSQLQTSGIIDAEYQNRENGLWWVNGHPEPEHPALIISRDMGVVLANTWKVFGSNAVTGGMKDNEPGINGCPSSNWHLNDYQIHPLIQSVNFSQTGYGIDRLNHQLGMQLSALTPVAYVNGEDNKVREEITALENDSYNRFLHKTGGLMSGSIAYDNLGIGSIFNGTEISFIGSGGSLAVRATGITFPDATVQTTAFNDIYLPLAGGTLTGAITIDESATSGFITTFNGDGLQMAGMPFELLVSQEETRIAGFDIELHPASSSTAIGKITFGDGTVQTTATLVGPPGTNGTNGINGINGTNGTNGANGTVWTYRGAYDNGVTYAANDYVDLDGSSYVMINTIGGGGYGPISHPYAWQLVAHKGDTGPQGSNGSDGSNGSNGIDGGSFPDVNYDSTPYIRYNQSWQPLSSFDQTGGGGISDAPSDGQFYARNNGNWQSFTTSTGTGISEAPYDGGAYVRQNNSWQPFSNFDQNSGGGGIGDAPYNGTPYIRINSDWQPLSSYDQTGGSQGPQGDPGPPGADGIGDAPYDGYPYIRINAGWQSLSSYAIGDAPYDNTSYVRINYSWAQTFRDLQGNASGSPYYSHEVKITVNGTDYWMPVRQA